MTIKELLETRAKHIADARAIRDAADKESRDLTGEEEGKIDALLDAADKAKDDADALQKRADRAARLDAAVEPAPDSSRSARSAPAQAPTAALERLPESFRRYLQSLDGPSLVPESERRALLTRASAEYQRDFRAMLLGSTERRTLQAGVAAEGGYLVPMQFAAQVIRNIDDELFIRRLATVVPVTGNSLGVPTETADLGDAEWTSELAVGSADTAQRFGLREWTPFPLGKEVAISKKLIRVAAVDIESYLASRLAYKFALTEEKAFLTGSGAGQPLGLFTAAATGIPTSRDVSTGNTTTAITFDGLINALFSLKAQYQASASWLFSRTAVKSLMAIKDGESRYMWQTSVQESQPDRLFGRPVYMSEYVPATFTTGLYVGMIGDFANYWIADGMNMEVTPLFELGARTNQVIYIGRLECDAMPVRSEAFARVKLA